jgi:hypothetical protein
MVDRSSEQRASMLDRRATRRDGHEATAHKRDAAHASFEEGGLATA